MTPTELFVQDCILLAKTFDKVCTSKSENLSLLGVGSHRNAVQVDVATVKTLIKHFEIKSEDVKIEGDSTVELWITIQDVQFFALL